MPSKKQKAIKSPEGGSKGACDLSSIYSRLHRINGQVSAVEKMLRKKRDCASVLQQIVAAREALDKVAVLVVESETQGCLSKNKGAKAAKELNKIVRALFKAI